MMATRDADALGINGCRILRKPGCRPSLTPRPSTPTVSPACLLPRPPRARWMHGGEVRMPCGFAGLCCRRSLRRRISVFQHVESAPVGYGRAGHGCVLICPASIGAFKHVAWPRSLAIINQFTLALSGDAPGAFRSTFRTMNPVHRRMGERARCRYRSSGSGGHAADRFNTGRMVSPPWQGRRMGQTRAHGPSGWERLLLAAAHPFFSLCGPLV